MLGRIAVEPSLVVIWRMIGAEGVFGDVGCETPYFVRAVGTVEGEVAVGVFDVGVLLDAALGKRDGKRGAGEHRMLDVRFWLGLGGQEVRRVVDLGVRAEDGRCGTDACTYGWQAPEDVGRVNIRDHEST